MARSRNIKPGFFMNELLAEAPFEARLLFIGLWTLADREGRLEDRPKRIKAELFPFDSVDVDPMLSRLQGDGFLIRYEADGKGYIQIENFVKHQDPHYKEKASVIPAPPGRENFILASGVTRTQRSRIFERDGFKCLSCGVIDNLCVDHILPVSRGGDSQDENLQTLCASCNTKKGNKLDGEEKNSRQRRVNVVPSLDQGKAPSPSDSRFLIPDPTKDTHTPLAQDFVLPKSWGEWAIAEFAHWTPEVIRSISAQFSDHHHAAAAESADWSASWRKWCRDPLTQKAHPPPKAPQAHGPPSPVLTVPSEAASATKALLAAQAAKKADMGTPPASLLAMRSKRQAEIQEDAA